METPHFPEFFDRILEFTILLLYNKNNNVTAYIDIWKKEGNHDHL